MIDGSLFPIFAVITMFVFVMIWSGLSFYRRIMEGLLLDTGVITFGVDRIRMDRNGRV